MTEKQVVVVDYGAGNLDNVLKAMRFVGLQPVVSADSAVIQNAAAVVIPGVGAFKSAKQRLDERGLSDVLIDFAKQGKPLFGVCLGMQLLFDSSEEFGLTQGLGLIPGVVKGLPVQADFKVPQMGWNQNVVQQAHPLSAQLNQRYTYFVHSFYAQTPAEYVVASAPYGVVDVPSVVAKQNVMGAQFHPEKSGEVGLDVWRAFAEMVK